MGVESVHIIRTLDTKLLKQNAQEIRYHTLNIRLVDLGDIKLDRTFNKHAEVIML